jgi:putative methyltransferase (TIGR04325 family)
LEKVLSASLEVQKGNFAFERDSVGFKKPSFDWPLIATFLHEAISKNGTLSILDFGGSLGSSYFQHLPMLSECNLSWHVIEQKHFVAAGKKYFQSESLHFHESIDECISQIEIDIVLLSSVMQYLEDPESTIRHVWQTGANKILIDKTMVNYSDTNRIYLQNVPSSIYNASYPCRSLSEKWLMNEFSDHYQLVADFTSLPFPELKHIDSYFKGFLLQKTA